MSSGSSKNTANKIDTSKQFDLFICQLSTNDTHDANITLGDIEKSIRFILEYVKTTFHCPIVFYTGTYFNSERYFDMIKLLYRLQDEYDFYILDLYHDEEMLHVSAEKRQNYMKDLVHPTLLGYEEWWTPKFIKFCEQI